MSMIRQGKGAQRRLAQQKRRKFNRKIRSLSRKSEIKALDYGFSGGTYMLPLFTAITGMDGSIVSDNTGAGYGMMCVNEVESGTDSCNRVGRKLRMRAVTVSGTVTYNGTTGWNLVRCLLVLDKSPSGAYPLLSDVLSLYDGGNQSFTPTFDAPLNPTLTDRFKICVDKYVTLDHLNIQSEHFQIRYFFVRQTPVQFTGLTEDEGTIASMSQNAVYLIIGSQVFAGTSGSDSSVILNSINVRASYWDD